MSARPVVVAEASPPAPTVTVRVEKTAELLEEWARLARRKAAECEAYAADLERQAQEKRRVRGW